MTDQQAGLAPKGFVFTTADEVRDRYLNMQAEAQADTFARMTTALEKTLTDNAIMRGQCQGYQKALTIIAAEFARKANR